MLQTMKSVKVGMEEEPVRFMSGDLSEFVERASQNGSTTGQYNNARFLGGMNYQQALSAARNGDIAGVEASDRFMDEIGHLVHVTRRWATVPAVSGGAPNVGAYLAGSPVAMRQRRRVVADQAPMTILVDCVSSGGIPASAIKKRGAAALALARVLSVNRQVNVYAVGGGLPMGGAKTTTCIMVKLESPLDLSRAGFAIAHSAMSRGLVYCTIENEEKKTGTRVSAGCLNWGFGDAETYKRVAHAMYSAELGIDVRDSLFLPPPYMGDDIISNPVQWLKDMMDKYGGEKHDA